MPMSSFVTSCEYKYVGSVVSTQQTRNICIYCTSQAVETESHFLLECNLIIKERMDILETVNIYLPVNNNYATNEHKFVAIMSCDEKFITDALGKFIYTCLNKRNTCTAITIK